MKDDDICISPEELTKLDETSREFLRQAHRGGMRYTAENGEVCAWGAATDGIFKMEVHVEKHSIDGLLVTLRQ